MSNNRVLTLIAAVLLVGSNLAVALPVGPDITIYDGNSDAPTGWHGMQEDDETEPGTATDQSWDLEGFFTYDDDFTTYGNKLGMVGGYDFTDLVMPDHIAGDIFIDIDGNIDTDPVASGVDVNATFGYEYVMDIDWVNLTYELIRLDASTWTTTVNYVVTTPSNPFAWVSGGTQIGGTQSFTYEAGLTDGDTGYSGGSGPGAGLHYAVYGFDLSFIAPQTNYTTHFTMNCGNDNLMGNANTGVPVPGTLFLLGLGLLGLGVGRARKNVSLA